MRKLIMLGTGNAMVSRCFNTCFALELERDEFFLTDTGGGNGIFRQIDAAGIPWSGIHHVFLTHGHTDHILGLPWLIRKVGSLIAKGKYRGELNLYGHDEVLYLARTLVRLMLKKSERALLDTRIRLHVLQDGEQLELPGARLTAFDIMSTKAKQFGYLLELPEGLRFCCLGDEPYNPHDAQYVRNADWLLCEAFCKYEDRERFKPYEKHHSTVKEAGEIAGKLGAKHLLLYHTEEETLDTRKQFYTAEARRYFHGRVFVPDDLETIDLDEDI